MPGFSVGISANETFPGSYSRNGDLIMEAFTVNPTDSLPLPYGAAAFTNSSSTLPLGGTVSNPLSLATTFIGTTNSNTTISGISNTATAYFGGPLQVGMQIIASGVQPGAVIASIVNSTSITITLGSISSLSGTTISALSPLLSTAGFVGIAAREVKTVESYANLYGPLGSQTSPNFGVYNQATTADVLVRGSCSIQIVPTQAPVLWGLLYLRVAKNPTTPYLQIGGFESVPDGTFSFAVPNTRFSNASVDQNGVCEVSILSRNVS